MPEDEVLPNEAPSIEEIDNDTKDSVNRITVYRLKTRLSSTNGLYIDGFYEAFTNDGFGTPESDRKYSIYFQSPDTNPPKWLDLFSKLDIDYFSDVDSRKPVVANSGYILIVNQPDSSYVCTGGNGHFRLSGNLEPHPRFGIDIARRILKRGELKSLAQKDTTSFVHSIERVFRSKYQPNNDSDNLHRILTNLRGTLNKERSERKEIGTSIKASDSLSVTGKKTLEDLFVFINSIDIIYHSQPEVDESALQLPELSWIDPNKKALEIELLNTALCNKLIELYRNPIAENTLFIDSEKIQFLPDVTEKFEIRFKRQSYDCSNDYEQALKTIGQILSNSSSPANEFDKVRIAVHCIEAAAPFEKPAIELICGDVEHNNDSYFLSSGRWYCANQNFKEVLDKEIDEIPVIEPEEVGLKEWTSTDKEDDYNKKHRDGTTVLLDKHFVRIAEEKGPIEFCDLLAVKENKYNLIHVKHDCGAALRALFAQAYVATKLYKEDDEFRKNVHEGNIGSKDNLTPEDFAHLKKLELQKKQSIRIVMAIYDDEPSHTVSNTSLQLDASSTLSGTLTLFAKVDLLQRCQSLRSMGYQVALTRIRPYPVR